MANRPHASVLSRITLALAAIVVVSASFSSQSKAAVVASGSAAAGQFSSARVTDVSFDGGPTVVHHYP